MTTNEMIDAIRKGDRLGHKTMQSIADKLESQHDELQQFEKHFEYNQEIAQMREAMCRAAGKALKASHDGNNGCVACGAIGGEHTRGCPITPEQFEHLLNLPIGFTDLNVSGTAKTLSSPWRLVEQSEK